MKPLMNKYYSVITFVERVIPEEARRKAGALSPIYRHRIGTDEYSFNFIREDIERLLTIKGLFTHD